MVINTSRTEEKSRTYAVRVGGGPDVEALTRVVSRVSVDSNSDDWKDVRLAADARFKNEVVFSFLLWLPGDVVGLRGVVVCWVQPAAMLPWPTPPPPEMMSVTTCAPFVTYSRLVDARKSYFGG